MYFFLLGLDRTLCSNEYGEYIAKRIHDAITFYSKAARDPKLEPLVNFLLWDLKISNQTPSIINLFTLPQGWFRRF